ncbi:S1 family peptidase [Pleionea sediminis]|uniref:S1 family peptidase n=1 Tax=Pleionea sediminis TaxID=2569479 RepID=UPI001184B4B4|nr:S1 family peptidase [Pleionea sediminis]
MTLYARVVNSNEYMHSATVGKVTNEQIVYIFDNADVNLRATSGAPVINQQYELIGINLAGGELGNGKIIGFANPVQSIIDNLKK